MDVATRIFRSATSLESFVRMIRALPQSFVHAEVQSLGGAAPAAPNEPAEPAPISGADAALQAALRAPVAPVRRDGPKVGRNDPCPCGSGKKYKKCCGAAFV